MYRYALGSLTAGRVIGTKAVIKNRPMFWTNLSGERLPLPGQEDKECHLDDW